MKDMAGSVELPLSPKSPQHSTLELIKHDATLAAPERDHAVVAPESSRDGDAPQIALVAAPEIFYSDSPPEAIPTDEKRNSLQTGSLATSPSSRLSSRMVIVITAIIAAVIVGLAVGIGMGLGLKRQSASSNVSTMVPSAVASTSPSSSSPSTSPLTDKQILDDTSIAALALPNGDRRLFFQDLSGLIRQASHSSSSGEGRADTNYVVASNARTRTPIAAVNLPSRNYSIPGNGSTAVSFSPTNAVFYISVNNSLACVQINDGAWGNSNPEFANISQFTAASTSRHLAVTVNPETTSFNTSLVYESIDENITFLEGSLTVLTSSDEFIFDPPNTTAGSVSATTTATLAVPKPVWTWKNSTAKLQGSRQNNSLLFAAPFTSSFAEKFTETLFTGKYTNGSYSDEALVAIVFGHDGSFSTYNSPENIDPAGIQKSDLVTIASKSGDMSDLQYGFCVKDKRLVSLGITEHGFRPIPSTPTTPYPFARLAGLKPAITTNFFIYHQLNASTFAEDQWDDTVGGWVSNLFSIATA
ncbi:ToMV susceptible protein tm-1(GCR26) [Physcia stellaris]|nr:ToMV susceptible protein tm-1(GCR26) [Physcia stellaris]